MHQCESTGALWWTMFRTYTRQGLCKSDRGVFWYPAWCLTSRFFFFPASSSRIELCQSDAEPRLCYHLRSRSHYADRQRCRPFQHVHLPPGLLSKAWDRGTWSILVFDQFFWRPKTAASSCIIVIVRTSTSSISASNVTSSAKSRSVNTSFPKVTPTIPRCAVSSIIWSILDRLHSTAQLDAITYCKPIGQHAVSTDTITCVRVQGSTGY